MHTDYAYINFFFSFFFSVKYFCLIHLIVVFVSMFLFFLSHSLSFFRFLLVLVCLKTYLCSRVCTILDSLTYSLARSLEYKISSSSSSSCAALRLLWTYTKKCMKEIKFIFVCKRWIIFVVWYLSISQSSLSRLKVALIHECVVGKSALL